MPSNLSDSALDDIWNQARNELAAKDTYNAEELAVFQQYKEIHTTLATACLAPQKAIDLAKAIMPVTTRRFVIGQLFRPNMALGFARGAVSQVQFEAEDVRVRLQIEELPSGWRIWGRTSEPGYTIWSGEKSQPCDSNGDFYLETESQSIEPLSLQNDSMTILLPMSNNETTDGDS